MINYRIRFQTFSGVLILSKRKIEDPWTLVAEELENGEKDKGLWLRAEMLAGIGASENEIKHYYVPKRIEALGGDPNFIEIEAPEVSDLPDEIDLLEVPSSHNDDIEVSEETNLPDEIDLLEDSSYHNDDEDEEDEERANRKLRKQRPNMGRYTNKSYLEKWLSGDINLQTTYWGLFFLPNIFISVILKGFNSSYRYEEIGLFLIIPFSLYSGLAGYATINSALKYRGSQIWSILAIVAGVLGILSASIGCLAGIAFLISA